MVNGSNQNKTPCFAHTRPQEQLIYIAKDTGNVVYARTSKIPDNQGADLPHSSMEKIKNLQT